MTSMLVYFSRHPTSVPFFPSLTSLTLTLTVNFSQLYLSFECCVHVFITRLVVVKNLFVAFFIIGFSWLYWIITASRISIVNSKTFRYTLNILYIAMVEKKSISMHLPPYIHSFIVQVSKDFLASLCYSFVIVESLISSHIQFMLWFSSHFR